MDLKHVDLDDIYLQLNREHRAKLRNFENAYKTTLENLREQIRILVEDCNRLNVQLKDMLAQKGQIDIQIIEVEKEIEKGGVEKDEEIKKLLQRQRELIDDNANLTNQLRDIIFQMEEKQDQLDSCDLAIKNLGNAMEDVYQSVAGTYQILEKTDINSEDVDRQRAENEFAIAQKQEELRVMKIRREGEVKEKNEEMQRALGVFAIIRVRCEDAKNSFVKVDPLPGGQKQIQIQIPNTKQSATLVSTRSLQIVDDRDDERCSTNPFFKDKGTYDTEKYNRYKSHLLQWAEREQNGEEYKAIVKNIDAKNYEASNTRIQQILPKDLYTEYQYVFNYDRQKKYTDEQTFFLTKQFVNQTSLRFIDEFQLGNLPPKITIIAVGASASGKTTTQSGLFQELVAKYLQRLPELGVDLSKTTIRVRFREVFWNHETKQIEIIALDPEFDSKVFLVPYSRPHLLPNRVRGRTAFYERRSGRPREDPTFHNALILCTPASAREVKATKTCNLLLRVGDTLITDRIALDQQLGEADRRAELARTIKYTPINMNGSSRGIRVTTITCKQAVRGGNVIFQLNLVDTAGFEYFNTQNLTGEMVQLIGDTYRSDPNYATWIGAQRQPNESDDNVIKREIIRYRDEIQAESNFIRGSLDYIKKAVMLLNQYHKGKLAEDEYQTQSANLKEGLEDKDGKFLGVANGQNNWLHLPQIFQQEDTSTLLDKDTSVILLGTIHPNPENDMEAQSNFKTFAFLDDVSKSGE
jgi:uncharacterized protein YoxC